MQARSLSHHHTPESTPTFLNADVIQFLDQAANPDVAGELQRNGANLVWHTGTLARALEWDTQVVNVLDYGAANDNSADATTAINAAIAAAYLNLTIDVGGSVYFPAGIYLINGTILVEDDRIHLIGAGKQATVFLFNPSSNNLPCVHFTKGVSVLYQCSMRGFAISRTGSATGAIGIQASDTSELLVEDVAMLMGTTLASVGIKLLGREFTTLQRIQVSAVQPLVIGNNPNASPGGSDHLHVTDFYGTAATGSDVITIEDDTFITNMTFDGYQGWVGGRHGLNWTVSAAAGDLNIRFANVRREQGASATAYAFLIDKTTGAVYNLSFENCYIGGTTRGFYLRGCQQVSLRNVNLDIAANALDANNTCASLVLSNVAFHASATTTLTGLTKVFALGRSELGGTVEQLTVYDVPDAATTASITLPAGLGTATYRPSGVIHINVTPQATVGTTEETLATYTLPANTLSTAGRGIRVTAVFTTAANANSKIARICWNGAGGNPIAQVGTTSSGAGIRLQGEVFRTTGAGAQVDGGTGTANATAVNVSGQAETATLTADVDILIRGTTPTAIGDLTFQYMIVELL